MDPRAPLSLAALALTGCGPKPFSIAIPIGGSGRPAVPAYVHEIPATTPIPLEAKAAVVVFVRPSGGGKMTPILDERGRFLGASLASSYFAAVVPPGDHVFVACAGEGAALRARLAPGKRYFVEVSVESFIVSAAQMKPIRPGSESWGNLTRWYTEKRRFVADEAEGQADLGDRAQECARDAQARAGADVIAPEDGQ